MDAITIKTVEQFIAQVRADSAGWPYKWFRGEPAADTPLIPKLYRLRPDGRARDENTLLQLFRMRAPTFSTRPCPDRGATDQWLFLAQHFGLPTRLLDWTESALVGLYFAIQESKPPKPKPHVVWMLNPTELNQLSVSPGRVPIGSNEFPLTWVDPRPKEINIGFINICGAWENDAQGVSLPVAIRPTNIDPRMSAQRSCFTVQGKDKNSLAQLVPGVLKRYEVEPNDRQKMRDDLLMLGVSHSTVFPDLTGLANELGDLY
jgi:hypothetical protein